MQHLVDEMRHAAQMCREAAARYTRLSEKIDSQEQERGIALGLDANSILKAVADRKEQSIRLKQFGGQRDFWSDEQQRLALHVMAEVAYAQHRRAEVVGLYPSVAPRMRTGGV